MSESYHETTADRVRRLPESQQKMFEDFFEHFGSRRSSMKKIETFALHFLEYGNDVDIAKYVSKKTALEQIEFRLSPYAFPELYGSRRAEWAESADEANKAELYFDAAFAYVLSSRYAAQSGSQWNTLGIVAFVPDFKSGILKIDQLQASKKTDDVRRMRRHLRVASGEEPNVSEVLFDIARGFAKSRNMRVAVRNPKTSVWRAEIAQRPAGSETPNERIARKYNLSLRPGSLYFIENR